MILRFAVLLLFFLSSPGRGGGDDPRLEALLATITPEECQAQVEVLASPRFQGRETPSRGLERAAAYVEEQLRTLGLEPAGEKEGYRLSYHHRALEAGETCSFEWSGEGGKRELRLGKEFLPVPRSASGPVSAPAVFVGYAIQSRKDHWNDLDPARVRGRIVFAFTREPRADDPRARTFDGAEPTSWSRFRDKAEAVRKAGGVALVLVPDPAGFPEESGPVPQLVPRLIPENLPLSRLGTFGIPVVSVSRSVAEELFGADLREFQKGIDRKYRPARLEPPKGTRVRLEVAWKEGPAPLFNLAARIRGSGDTGEVVVLGAHLDHLGFNNPLTGGTLQLHPGADDNASGSGALLEIAQAFAGSKPSRDLLFLWFTGEEKGLLGSQAYCEHPLYPMEKTFLMINMDMVGRGDPRKLNIGGLWKHPEWEKRVRAAHHRIHSPLKLDLRSGRDLFARSDQFSFAQKGVVALFFFEADLEHNATYHRPADVSATMDGRKMALIAKLCAATAYDAAFDPREPASK